jgi:hypothetical protein
MGGSDGGGIMSSDGGGYLECTSHYDRMPLPIPIVPPPPPNMHSEDEIEPAYATGELCVLVLWLTIFNSIFSLSECGSASSTTSISIGGPEYL